MRTSRRSPSLVACLAPRLRGRADARSRATRCPSSRRGTPTRRSASRRCPSGTPRPCCRRRCSPGPTTACATRSAPTASCTSTAWRAISATSRSRATSCCARACARSKSPPRCGPSKTTTSPRRSRRPRSGPSSVAGSLRASLRRRRWACPTPRGRSCSRSTAPGRTRAARRRTRRFGSTCASRTPSASLPGRPRCGSVRGQSRRSSASSTASRSRSSPATSRSSGSPPALRERRASSVRSPTRTCASRSCSRTMRPRISSAGTASSWRRSASRPIWRRALVEHPWLTSRHRTILISSLAALEGTENGTALVEAALNARSETDALVYQRIAELVRGIHERVAPIERLASDGRFVRAYLPAACASRRSRWTSCSGRDRSHGSPMPAPARIREGVALTRRELWLTGTASPRARAELEARGFVLVEYAFAHLDYSGGAPVRAALALLLVLALSAADRRRAREGPPPRRSRACPRRRRRATPGARRRSRSRRRSASSRTRPCARTCRRSARGSRAMRPASATTTSFEIADDGAPNAFALPGGRVYISRGALGAHRVEDELANVLGHEIAHVASRHAAAQQQVAGNAVDARAPVPVAPGVLARAREQRRSARPGPRRGERLRPERHGHLPGRARRARAPADRDLASSPASSTRIRVRPDARTRWRCARARCTGPAGRRSRAARPTTCAGSKGSPWAPTSHRACSTARASCTRTSPSRCAFRMAGRR